MTAENFEIEAYSEMWKDLDMDVERFDKMRLMLGEIYEKTYLSQKNRLSSMAYFDNMIAEIHGGRIKELLDAKKEGKPVIGTFCVYIPEEIVLRQEVSASVFAAVHRVLYPMRKRSCRAISAPW